MSNRALIIALWKYPNVQGLAPVTLDDVPQGAANFYEWLVQDERIAPADILLCADGPLEVKDATGTLTQVQPDFGTGKSAVLQAIGALVSVGRDTTADLFLYMAGHGFSFRNTRNDLGSTYLITSDFTTATVSGDACLNIPLLQRTLSSSLAGNHHFLFVDACRNELDATSIQPSVNVGVAAPPSNNDSASYYVLYSTREGQVASATGAFNSALLKALKGQGKAKTWGDDNQMWITFDRVSQFVSAALGTGLPVEAHELAGPNSDDHIRLAPQPWPQTCTINVNNHVHGGKYQLTVLTPGGGKNVQEFLDPPYHFTLDPADRPYQLALQQSALNFRRTTPPDPFRMDMYDPCDLIFEAVPAPPPALSPAAMEFQVSGSPATDFIRVSSSRAIAPTSPATSVGAARVSLNTSFLESLGNARGVRDVRLNGRQSLLSSPNAWEPRISDEIEAGSYQVALIEEGKPVWTDEVHLNPGVNTVAIGRTAPHLFQQAMLKTIGQEGARTPELSEALGHSGDWDVNLWLAYLGTVLIRPSAGLYYKLEQVLQSVPPLSEIYPGKAAALVLIMLEQGTPKVALHTDATPIWEVALPVPGTPTLYYAVAPMDPGSASLSVDVPESGVFTYATCFVPGEYTLLTCSFANGAARLQQFAIPPLKAGTMRDGWSHHDMEDLQTTRMLSNAQTGYARSKKVLRTAIATDALWSSFISGKWRNGQLASLCALEAKYRKGEDDTLQSLLMHYPISSHRGFETDLDWLRPELDQDRLPIPLLLDALLLQPECVPTSLPLSHIDYRGLWVSWFGAIEGR